MKKNNIKHISNTMFEFTTPLTLETNIIVRAAYIRDINDIKSEYSELDRISRKIFLNDNLDEYLNIIYYISGQSTYLLDFMLNVTYEQINTTQDIINVVMFKQFEKDLLDGI